MSVFSHAVGVRSLQQNLFELVAAGGKRVSPLHGFRRLDVPYGVPDSGGQHSQINELKARKQEPFAMQGVFLKILFGGMGKKKKKGKSSATSQYSDLCCILHIDWDQKYCDTNLASQLRRI